MKLFITILIILFFSGCGSQTNTNDGKDTGGKSDTTPSIPTNLQATANSPSQISLSWSASTDSPFQYIMQTKDKSHL